MPAMTDHVLPERNPDAIDALLSRVAGGDRAAFEHLYRDAAPLLLGICLRVLPDRADAEDVLQDVFVTVWRKAAQFDGARARALTWMGAIARNRAIDRLRAMPHVPRAPMDAVEDAPDPAPSPAMQAQAREEKARLDACVEELDQRRKQLIRTAFFDNVTYEELAARTGSPIGSIKSWIRRGLQQLRACLER
jgi:RNA polymerase sigma-70 factor (ECF subfamily)